MTHRVCLRMQVIETDPTVLNVVMKLADLRNAAYAVRAVCAADVKRKRRQPTLLVHTVG